MDLRSALAAVADQIKTKPSVQRKKKVVSKKKKQQTSKKEDSSEQSHLEPEIDKQKEKIVVALDSCKKALQDLNSIKSFFSTKCESLNDDNFLIEASSIILQVKTQVSNTTQAPGLRPQLKKIINECNSLLDGLSSNDVSLKEFSLNTIDLAIEKARNLVRIYTKKDKNITDIDENAMFISDMMKNNTFKKLSEDTISEDTNKTIISGYAVMPLGSFSAKLLAKYFNADSSSGYPIIPNQSFYVIKTEENRTVDIEEELNRLSASSASPYALVAKMPKFHNKFMVYWVMTQRQLDMLKRSAAYQDYMMIKAWEFL